MNKERRILLSIPSVLILLLIPFNFFAELEGEDITLFYNVITGLYVVYWLSLIYILIQLWRDVLKTKSTKWTWTILTIFCMPPVTTLVYLWAVEPERKKK